MLTYPTDKQLEKIAAGEIRHSKCQFPLSKPFNPRNPEFCGERTTEIGGHRVSYCEQHYKMCYSGIMRVR